MESPFAVCLRLSDRCGLLCVNEQDAVQLSDQRFILHITSSAIRRHPCFKCSSTIPTCRIIGLLVNEFDLCNLGQDLHCQHTFLDTVILVY